MYVCMYVSAMLASYISHIASDCNSTIMLYLHKYELSMAVKTWIHSSGSKTLNMLAAIFII